MQTQQWGSVAEFFAMGGYGLYVWGSYGVGLLLMGLEPWLAARRRRRAVQDAAAAEVWDDKR
ncbi:MAG: heme exporter protein CcmD [Chitinophagaceae bacterium]|nr:heme exporter protein CcmD [Rubrivivax sp.]